MPGYPAMLGKHLWAVLLGVKPGVDDLIKILPQLLRIEFCRRNLFLRPRLVTLIRRASLVRDRRGSVLLMTALTMPVCIGVMALGIDISYWEAQRVKLQQIADIAALAGSVRYAQTGDVTGALKAAANLAELNGVPVGTRTLTGGTALTDNYGDWVTTYGFDSSTAKLTATIQTSAPVWFGRLYTAATKQTLSATAVAQATSSIGGHPCIIATKGDTTGVVTYVDLTITGNTSVTSSTCGIRSDGGLSVGNSATVSVPTVIASGSINLNGGGTIICSPSPCQQSGAPQVPDPFSSAYGSALSVPAGSTAGTYTYSSGTYTYTPGTYSSDLKFSGNNTYNLSPGVYYVNGSIGIGGGVTVTGNGVTLISTGGISMAGSSSVTLTAPSTGPTAGLLFGTRASSGTFSLVGNSTNILNGAVYAPNANVTLTGNSSSTNSLPSTCFEIVASTVGFTGNAGFTNSGCGSLGVPVLDNSPVVARLVE